jgi:hypothetical protein
LGRCSKNIVENYLMKTKILLNGAAALLILLATAWAASISGKWVAKMNGGPMGSSEVTFDFKVDGTTLTGTMTSSRGESQISEGKINGDELSFVVVRKFGDREMKTQWKGKVTGDEIKFIREFPDGGPGGPGGPGAGAPGPGGPGPGGPGGGGPPRELVAKRAK